MATYDSIHEALPRELKRLLTKGAQRASRNGAMREALARKITLRYPDERFMNLPHRGNNPFAQVAETLWVLAGRNDLDFLRYYLPRCDAFSDDGATWRAGYGPRLRRWNGVDQVAECLRILHADPTSRRAVISLFDPQNDFIDSKDIPCNNWLQFLVRDGALNMHVVTRSNDVMWGWSGINAFEWSVLQEAMASDLDVPVGAATFFAGSFHLYARHYERAQRIVENDQHATSLYTMDAGRDYIVNDVSWAQFVEDVETVLRGENQWRQNVGSALAARELVAVKSAFLRQCGYMLRAYSAYQQGIDATPYLKDFCEGDFLIAAQNWLEKHSPTSDSTPDAEADSRATYTVVGGKSTDSLVPTPPRLAKWGATPKVADPASDPASDPAPGPTNRHGVRVRAARAWERVLSTLVALEAAKSRAYGDSWKKHGEVASIFANISRKADRLATLRAGAQPTSDETLLDTVADLAVYAIKYLGWLNGRYATPVATTFHEAAHRLHVFASDFQYELSYDGCYEQIATNYALLEQLLLNPTPANLQSSAATRTAKWRATAAVARAAIQYLALAATSESQDMRAGYDAFEATWNGGMEVRNAD